MRYLLILFFILIPFRVDAFQLIRQAPVVSGDPATGTLLVGTNSHSTTDVNVPAQHLPCDTKTATTSGTAHTMVWFEGAWDGTASKGVVYDASGNKLGETAATSIASGEKTSSLISAVTITAGTDYKICIFSNNYLSLGFTGSGSLPEVNNSVTYPTAPTTYTNSSAASYASMHIFLEQ